MINSTNPHLPLQQHQTSLNPSVRPSSQAIKFREERRVYAVEEASQRDDAESGTRNMPAPLLGI